MISLQDLERMIDSSLVVADQVLWDHREIQGELFLWRHAKWRYFPFDFEVLYIVENSCARVTKFASRINLNDSTQGEWIPIKDTAAYRELLFRADSSRKQVP